MTKIGHQFVTTNGIRLHVASAGPENGPLLVFLHGFPDFWGGWQTQIERFAGLGYRVLAPDQRGYGESDKPTRVRDYEINQLAADVVGLIEWAGRKSAAVVGHDWGAGVAWWLATMQPERVEKLIVINVPHPFVIARNLLFRNPRQMMRSWYMFVFQLPRLPEWVLSRKRADVLFRGLKKSPAFGDEELEKYREAWLRPGAATGMVNWYRAAFRYPVSIRRKPRVTVPTLIIWGTRDIYLRQELAHQSASLCENGRVELIPDAGHWVPHERPERVSELIEAFCR